jgi:hypothetical protein
METFKNIRPGDWVTFLNYAGMSLRGPEYRRRRAKAVLCFDTHVTCNAGGRHGIPVVVDARNYISHRAAKRGAK